MNKLAYLQVGLGVFFALIAATAALPMIAKSKQIHSEFSIDMPIFTVLLIEYGHWLILLPFVTVAVYLFWPHKPRRAVAALIAGTLCLVIILPLRLFLMSLPLLNLRLPLEPLAESPVSIGHKMS